MDTPAIIAITGIVTTFTGSILGALIGRYTAMNAIKRQSFFNAGREFIKSFIDELIILEGITGIPDGRKVEDIIEDSIKKHAEAMITFEFYLRDRYREQFRIAWRAYANPSGAKDNEQRRDEYFNDGYTSQERDKRKIVINRINNLLSFTEKT